MRMQQHYSLQVVVAVVDITMAIGMVQHLQVGKMEAMQEGQMPITTQDQAAEEQTGMEPQDQPMAVMVEGFFLVVVGTTIITMKKESVLKMEELAVMVCMAEAVALEVELADMVVPVVEVVTLVVELHITEMVTLVVVVDPII